MRSVVVFVVTALRPLRRRLQEVHASRHLLHCSIEGVTDATAEVDKSTSNISLGSLEIHDNGCAVLRLCILYGAKGEPKRKARSGGVAVYILACTADDAGVCGLAGVVFVECANVFCGLIFW